MEIDLWIKLVILDYAILKKRLLDIISEWCIYLEAKNRAFDAISRHPTGDLIPPKMQLSDDVFHISHFTLSLKLNIPLQLIAGIHLEDQQLCDDMENSFMYSMAAQLQDIHTVNWNQVRTATSSDTDMLLLLSTIEEGMPDHRSQLPPQLRDYHQFREHL